MSLFGIFSGDKSSNTTTSNNDSRQFTEVDSHNVATNTTNNSTVNDTNTVTKDQRMVNDHGLGISAENSSLYTVDSGNNISTSTDTTNYFSTDQGAVAAGLSLGLAGIASNASLAGKTIDVSAVLANTGREMMTANLSFLQHVSDNSQAAARAAISEVAAATGNAMNQVVGIAAKPLNANDPQRLVIIVALGVLGIVFFSKLKG